MRASASRSSRASSSKSFVPSLPLRIPMLPNTRRPSIVGGSRVEPDCDLQRWGQPATSRCLPCGAQRSRRRAIGLQWQAFQKMQARGDLVWMGPDADRIGCFFAVAARTRLKRGARPDVVARYHRARARRRSVIPRAWATASSGTPGHCRLRHCQVAGTRPRGWNHSHLRPLPGRRTGRPSGGTGQRPGKASGR